MQKIYIADDNIREGLVEAIKRKIPQSWEISYTPEKADVILTENQNIDFGLLSKTNNKIKVIFRIDTGKAQVEDTTIPVVDLPNTALIGVAEHTVMLIITLAKHVIPVYESVKERKWEAGKEKPVFTDQTNYTYNWTGIKDFGLLYGKTVGLIGMGYIARHAAKRLNAFGMKVVYNKRNRLDREEEVSLGVQWREYEDLLKESDFVSLHHRFEEGEKGNDKQFGGREFSLMKDSAYLINTARGRLVDEDALIKSLKNGDIAGAGLDVSRYEPIQEDSPFFELMGDKIIMTPHIGGAPLDEAFDFIPRKISATLSK